MPLIELEIPLIELEIPPIELEICRQLVKPPRISLMQPEPAVHQGRNVVIKLEMYRHLVEHLHPLQEHCTGEPRSKTRRKNTQE